MANPSTYLDVEWAHDDLVLEQDMDQMQENADYVRYEAGYRPSMFFHGPLQVNWLGSFYSVRFMIELDSVEIGVSTESTSSSSTLRDVTNGALSVLGSSREGLHTLTVSVQGRSSSGGSWSTVGSANFKVFAGADSNYLSAWGYLAGAYSNPYAEAELGDVSVILHKDSEATW